MQPVGQQFRPVRPVHTGLDWYRLVQTGLNRFRLVHTGSDGFRLVQNGLDQFRPVQTCLDKHGTHDKCDTYDKLTHAGYGTHDSRGMRDAHDTHDLCNMRDKNDTHGGWDTCAGDDMCDKYGMHNKCDLRDKYDTHVRCGIRGRCDTHVGYDTHDKYDTHMTTTCKGMRQEPLANRQGSRCILKSCLCVLGWEYVLMYWCVWMHMEAMVNLMS